MARSEDSSQNSSGMPSRASSVGNGEPRNPKGHHRVKFSVGGYDGPQMPHETPRKPLPYMRLPPTTTRPIRAYVPDLMDSDSADVTDSPSAALNLEYPRRATQSSQISANQRARSLENSLGSTSAPVSRRASFEDSQALPLPPSGSHGYPVRIDDVPLVDMRRENDRRPYSLYDDSTDEDEEGPQKPTSKEKDWKEDGRKHSDDGDRSSGIL